MLTAIRRALRHASDELFVSRPFVQHSHPLADREPDARPVLDRPLEDAASVGSGSFAMLAATRRTFVARK